MPTKFSFTLCNIVCMFAHMQEFSLSECPRNHLLYLIRFLFSAYQDQILISWTFLELLFRFLHDNKTILIFLQISFPTLMAPYLLCSRHCVQRFCAAWNCNEMNFKAWWLLADCPAVILSYFSLWICYEIQIQIQRSQ